MLQLHISVNKGLGMGFTGTTRNQSMKILSDHDNDDDDDNNNNYYYKTLNVGNNIRCTING